MLNEDEKDEKNLLDEADNQDDSSEDSSEEEVKAKPSSKNDDSDEGADDEGDEDLSEYAKSTRNRINRLTFKRREAERREAEALEYARAVKAELDVLKKRESSISRSFETEAETRLTAQEELLRNNLRTAVDVGDVDKQVEIQSNLVRLATDRERLRNFKAYRQEAEAAPQRIQEQPQQQAQRQPRPDPKAQVWAEKNNWFGSDRIMTQAAYTIHEDLIGEGFNASGDDYYRELDNRIRREFPHKFQQTQRKPPVSSVGSARPGQAKKGGKDIELSDTQKSIANKLGVSYDAYKRQLKLTMERAE